jgi:hypothetical protein
MKSFYTLLSPLLLACALLFTVPLQAAEGGVDANVERVAQSVEKVAETVSKSVSEAQLAGTELVFDRMEGYFDAAQGVIKQYGGDVAELGLMALRIDAFSVLFPGLLFAVLAMVWCRFVKRVYQYEKDETRDGAGTIIASVIFGIVTLVVFAPALLNIWAWAGIFYPELWAIHKFILN